MKKLYNENKLLRLKIEDLSKHIKTLEASNSDLLHELKSLNSILNEKDASIAQLKSRLEGNSNEGKEKENQLVNDIQTLRENIRSLKETIEEKEGRYKKLEDQYKDYKVKARKVLNEKDDIISKYMGDNPNDRFVESGGKSSQESALIIDLSASKKYIKQIKQEKEALENQLVNFEESCRNLTKKVEKLQDDLEKEEQRCIKEISKREETIKQQKSLLESLQRNISFLSQSIESNKQVISDLHLDKSNLEDQVVDLKKQLNMAKKPNNKVPKDLLERIRLLEDQLLTKQSQIDVLLLDKRTDTVIHRHESVLPMPTTNNAHNRRGIRGFSPDDIIGKLSSMVPKTRPAKAALIVYLAILQIWTLYILFFSMNSIRDMSY